MSVEYFVVAMICDGHFSLDIFYFEHITYDTHPDPTVRVHQIITAAGFQIILKCFSLIDFPKSLDFCDN